ncbi:MAG TPA: FAD-dependent oxidoreductase, partial [Gemmatimonadaceae bacterium]
MNETFDYDLICIGSGPAGQRAAVQAAKLGRRAAIIERRGSLGGVCLDTGTIPSKTFREAVTWVVSAAARASGSVDGAATPRPTAEVLLARVSDVVSREAVVIASQLRRNGVDVLHGEASFRDPHHLVVHGGDASRDVSANNILIAVGTVAAPAPGAGSDGVTVLTSDDICRLARIPRTMTVVGAGVIGMEYASMFAALGVDVTVIDKRERPLEFLDTEIVDELMHQ